MGRLISNEQQKMSASLNDNNDGGSAIESVIRSLNLLSQVARNCGDDEISDLIESTFKICLAVHVISKRNELEKRFLT